MFTHRHTDMEPHQHATVTEAVDCNQAWENLRAEAYEDYAHELRAEQAREDQGYGVGRADQEHDRMVEAVGYGPPARA